MKLLKYIIFNLINNFIIIKFIIKKIYNLYKNQKIKKKIIGKPEGLDNFKICSSPISNKIYIKKTITSIRKSKNYKNIKDNLIKNIKKDIDEKLRVEREIAKINKEQNKLYNNFYENFVILRSAKTLDVEDNIYN